MAASFRSVLPSYLTHPLAGHSRQSSTESYPQHIGSGGGSGAGIETEFRQHLIVAVGSPLPTPSQPVGSQQGPVVLTAKNLQCMRLILGTTKTHFFIDGTVKLNLVHLNFKWSHIARVQFWDLLGILYWPLSR